MIIQKILNMDTVYIAIKKYLITNHYLFAKSVLIIKIKKIIHIVMDAEKRTIVLLIVLFVTHAIKNMRRGRV
jgi:stage V sporulation protein SpoVS